MAIAIRNHQRLVDDHKLPENIRRASMRWLKDHNLRRKCGCAWPKDDALP